MPDITSANYVILTKEEEIPFQADSTAIKTENDPYSVPGLYPSNSIGQIREQESDGYMINVTEAGQFFLLKNNVIVKRVQTESEGGGRTTKRETDANGDFISFSRYDKNGNLIEYIYKDRSYDILNFDSKNRLISVKTFTPEGEVKRNCVYYRDPKSGNVLGIKDNDRYSFFTQDSKRDIMITGDDKSYDIYETFFGTVTYKSSSNKEEESYDVSHTDEGLLVITRGNKKTVYSPEGRILEDGEKKYFYTKDGVLDYTEEKNKEITIKEFYKDASRIRREEYDNDIPVRTLVYQKDSIDTTLFENGVKYATITYAGDGYKVLKIKYYNDEKK